jgi:ABC-2 type transport system permease protein
VTKTEPRITEERLHAALASGARPPHPGRVSAAITFGWRAVLKIKHVPEQMIDVTITPVLFLLMFTYLFGGAVAGGTDAYLQYILPGVLAQSVVFVSVYSGVALNTDVTKGVTDRFRSLPIWRPAPLVGAVLGDSVRYVVAGSLVIVLGLILGFDADGGPLGVIAALALVVVFTFGLSWTFTTLGLTLRSPNAVLNTGFMLLFPLVVLSNTFVEPSTLPGWLEAFVNVNPVSHLVSATRDLANDAAVTGQVGWTLLAGVVVIAIFAPLSVLSYRRHL